MSRFGVGRLVRAGMFPIAGLGLLLFGGCSIVPKDGPTGEAVRTRAEVQVTDDSRLSYAFVQLSPLILKKFGSETDSPERFSRFVEATPSARVRVGPSDRLTLTIFEAAAGGLFIPQQAGARPGNFVEIPTQEVDRAGNISVPYVGVVRVVGRTIREIQAEIEDRLREKAIQPQVVVALNERMSTDVYVLGEVGTPTRMPLTPGGMKLLAALARAGGARHPNYESLVTLQRRGRVERALLANIINNPRQNVQLLPEDVIYLSREQRAFLAFGATPTPGALGGLNNRRFMFEAENLTLAEAVAKAGGLDSTRADPTSVFLFRLVPSEKLRRIGVEVAGPAQTLVPTIFTVILRDAEGFFVANNFYMRHKDMIFVSDSPSVDLVKFLDIVRTVTSTARDVVGVASDVDLLLRR